MNYNTIKNYTYDISDKFSKTHNVPIKIHYEKKNPVTGTRKDTNTIHINVKNMYKSKNIPFTDMVHHVIDVYHECYHVLQFYKIKNENRISEHTIQYCIEFSNPQYYYDNYYESILELDAQYNAIISAQQYLYEKYPDHKQTIDNHILYWSKMWFTAESCHQTLQTTMSTTSNLPEFMNKFDAYRNEYKQQTPYEHKHTLNKDHANTIIKKYRNDIRIDNYIHSFENAHTIEEQQLALFFISIFKNKDLEKEIPQITDKQELTKIRKHLTSIQQTHNELKSTLPQNIEHIETEI